MRTVLLALVVFAAAGCPETPPDADADLDGGLDGGLDAASDADAESVRPLGMIGDPCTIDEDCIITSDQGQVACLRQGWGFREGYCTVVGTRNEGDCQAADHLSTHVALPCAQPVCMRRCDDSVDCRPGYQCFLGEQACWPRCEPGRACPIPPPTLCAADDECDDGDPCTVDGCIGGICDHDRIDYQPRQVARIATLGRAVDVDFTGRIADDNLQLIVAEGEDGVEVFDLSNPTEPQIYFRLNTIGEARAALRHRNLIVVAEGLDGIELFPANGGAADEHVLVEDGAASVEGVSRLNNNALNVLAYRHGLYRYNVESRTLNGNTCDTRGRAVAAIHEGDITWVADSLAGLAVCSWAEGTTFATQIDRVDTDGRMLAISRYDEVLAAAEAGAGFGIFDVSVATLPSRRYASDSLEGDVLDLLLTGQTTMAIAASEGGLYLFALEDCFEPVLWYRWETDGPALAVDHSDGVIAIALGDQGIELLDIGCRAIEDEE